MRPDPGKDSKLHRRRRRVLLHRLVTSLVIADTSVRTCSLTCLNLRISSSKYHTVSIRRTGNQLSFLTIARFQVEMATESEGTALNYELVLRGVTEGIKDESKGTYLVARKNDDNEIVGSLLITREWSDWRCTWYWLIQSVYVRPEYRRQGVYSEMYDNVKKLAREKHRCIVYDSMPTETTCQPSLPIVHLA